MQTKRCSKCEEEKDIDLFYNDKKSKDGHTHWCKRCMDEVSIRNARKKRKPRPDWTASPGKKICRKCLIEKPIEDFNRHKYTKDKLRNECKECQKAHAHDHYKTIAPQERIKRKIYRKANMRSYHHWHLKNKFQISVDDYERMVKEQNGKCALCGTEKPYPNPRIKNFAVDHDHETGKVRALLCQSCNCGIGHFRHDISLLHKAIEYLRRFD